MRKYLVMKDITEVLIERNRAYTADEVADLYADQVYFDGNKIAEFDDLDSAKKFLEEQRVSTWTFVSAGKHKAQVTICYIQKVEVDEDGEEEYLDIIYAKADPIAYNEED